MIRKSFIGIIITLNLIILNVYSVFATTSAEVTSGISAAISALNAAEEGSARQQAVSNWIHKQSNALGFLFDLSSGSLPPATLKYLLPDPSQYENATDNEIVNACKDLILNHQTIVNNEITLDSTLNTCIKNFVDNYINNIWIEVHPFNLNDSRNYNWWTANESTYFNALKTLVSDNQEDYYVFFYGGRLYDNSRPLVICVKKDDVVLARQSGQYDITDNPNAYYIESFTLQTNGDIIRSYSSIPQSTKVFYWDSTNQTWYDGDSSFVQTNAFGNGFKCLAPKPDYYLTTTGTSWQGQNIVTTGKLFSIGQKTYYFYNSYSQYASVPSGCNPYYYNNSVWQDFSSSSGDYNLTNNNINTITYGDTVSYINDYHDTNNNYPDNSTVNTWIETTNNNNTGGGSGDDNGGGSGGSGDDSGSIFDWLKTLGKAIGDLISGVGNFLSEIVAGLVDAITNLLDAITTLITGVLESLTNIFSGLIEFIFAGLPDDIRNVLSLALTVAILISVLKLIRGN